jgi:isocitrate/isopropylmalate dehydrogenase
VRCCSLPARCSATSACEDHARHLRAAIRATLAAKDRVTPDLGGTGTTESFADSLIERVREPNPLAA